MEKLHQKIAINVLVMQKLNIILICRYASLMPKRDIELPTVKPFVNYILPDENHLIKE